MKYILCVLSLLTLGCSENSLLKSEADTGASSGNASDDYSDEDSVDTGESFSEPVWWSLGTRVDLKKGLLQAEGTLTISPLDEDGSPLCDEVTPYTVVEAVEEASPYKEVLVWWRLTLSVPDSLCDGISAPVGDTLYLGVGEMHPDISAAIEVVDGLDDALPLNGAYASLDGEAVFVFGVAGQDSAYAGEGKVAESVPLADGGWRVEPVYWFAY